MGYVDYNWQSVLKINCYSSFYFTTCFHIHALISFVIIKYLNYYHNTFILYERKKADSERLIYLSYGTQLHNGGSTSFAEAYL